MSPPVSRSVTGTFLTWEDVPFSGGDLGKHHPDGSTCFYTFLPDSTASC